MHPTSWKRVVGALVASSACATWTACPSDDATVIALPDAVSQASFGRPCIDDQSCDDHVCVPHIGTTVCSQACGASRPCPDGWSCWHPPAGSGEPSARPDAYCVSPYWALCRPCDNNADCASLTSESPGGCVDYLGEGAFCATPCDNGNACPEGFTCAETVTLAGGPGRRCINATGMCPCTPYLATLGVPTRCVTANDWGECVGERTCDNKLWSTCDARVPAPDAPNGFDDDCDGLTDELSCTCGDGLCDGNCGESVTSCPCDCAVEGDGVCSPCGESPLTAPVDCCRGPGGTSGCGDGFCVGFTCGETPATCPGDCSTACGNGVCEAGENPWVCAEDCLHKVCGNNVCESTDGGPEQCPQDCKAFCGDCECDPARDESHWNCPIDCGYCGDGECSPCRVLGEDVDTCGADCCEASPEACNGLDDDCDGDTDEGDAIGCTRYYLDADGDGLGLWSDVRCLCGPAAGFTARALGDCDDDDDATGGGGAEQCNGVDDDCDGETDEGFDLGATCAAPGGACFVGRVACDGPGATRCVDAAPASQGTLCAALGCEDGAIRPPATCDGAGACVGLPTIDCRGYACQRDGAGHATGRCLTTCGGDADCAPGWGCGLEGACEEGAATCAGDPAIVVGVSCRPSPTSCAAGAWACDEAGDPVCAVVGDAPAGIVCGPARCDAGGYALEARCDGQGACQSGATVSCRGHVCDDATGCGATCDASGGCVAGSFCFEGACVPTRVTGAGCVGDAMCTSGHCVDGVCCQTACDGACQRCGAGGVCAFASAGADPDDDCGPCGTCSEVGTCTDARAGTDPKGACDAEVGAPCGLSGSCDGRGGCALADAGTSCGAAGCRQGQLADAFLCDGLGSCEGADAIVCPEGLACDDAGIACRTACSEDQHCVVGRWCDGERCRVRLPLGAACATDRACLSGVCADGVCCDRRCDSGCESCATLSSPGTCKAYDQGSDPEEACARCRACDGAGACKDVPVGLDPLGDCAPGGGVCGTTGLCDGAGACDFVAAATPCGAAVCVGDTSVSARACDGEGTCVDPTIIACSGARCDPVTGLCRTSCASDAHCQAGFFCGAGGTCQGKRAQGATCGAGRECGSGFCVDGRCCDGACAGVCQACGAGGACGAATDGSEEPGCAGDMQCDGGACEKDDGVVCATADECASGHCEGNVCCQTACGGTCETCASGACEPVDHAQVPDRCAGASWCVDDACVAMSGSTCGPGGACLGGLVCREGACGPPASLGTTCASGAQCATGHCVDGVCCEGACVEVCHACGASGRCDPIAPGSPDACAGGLVCSAAGACGAVDGATCGDDGECASGACVDGRCCPEACGGTCESCATGTCLGLVGEAPGECCAVGALCLGRGVCGTITGGAGGPGDACDEPADCDSGACILIVATIGFCCDRACDGECETCAASDPLGTCSAVKGREHPGRCDGARWCDAEGVCVERVGADCGADDDCADGTFCDLAGGATCQPERAVAAGCGRDGECASGHCADGRCCDRACDGACEACDLSTSKGACTLVPTGTDDPACAGDEVCSREQGGCALAIGEGCASDGDCASDACAGGVCCDRACGGVCEACDLGVCEIVTNGETGVCQGPFQCDASGQCRQDPGTPCEGDAACATDRCDPVSERCCSVGCDGDCALCGPGGACLMVMGGEIAGRCDGVRWCDHTGVCVARDGEACVDAADCAPGFFCDRPDDLGPGACAPVASEGDACDADEGCASGVCADGVCCERACDGACETCARPGREGECLRADAGADPGERCGDGLACDVLGVCRGEVGQLCGVDADCVGRACADGRCCEGRCDGACERCDEPGHEGACRPIDGPGDIHCMSPFVCDAGQCLVGDGQPCASDTQCASGLCEPASLGAGNVCCQTECAGACAVCLVGSGACVALTRTEDLDAPSCAGASWCYEGACRAKVGTPCASGGDCPMDLWCDTSGGGGGVCRARGQLGDDCAADGECAGGICSHGRCCSQRCDAACAACDGGMCTFAAAGTDPGDLLCPGAAVCGMDGSCKQPLGASCGGDAMSCASGMCVDGVCCASPCAGTCERCDTSGTCVGVDDGADGTCSGTFECAGQGQCRLADGQACVSPSMCASSVCISGRCCAGACGVGQWCPGEGGACADITSTACTSSLQCPGGYYCDGATGHCAERKAPGAECTGTSTGECATGLCSDGVCCDRACTLPCEDCAGGLCIRDPAGSDPRDACPGAATCGMDGQCKLPLGADCSADPMSCASGTCVDSVCCASPCSGLCERCDATGACVGVDAGPDAACNGVFECAGQGQCKIADGQPCSFPAMCASNVCLGGRCCAEACAGGQWCPGAGGACVDITSTPCSATTDCPSGYFCDGMPGHCAERRSPGATCSGTASDECLMGLCSDGVCCDRPCTQPCEDCASGMCMKDMAGTDPREACPGVAVCGADGQCKLPLGEACGTDGSLCLSGICVDGVCCGDPCSATCMACGASGMCMGLSSGHDGTCQGSYECAGPGICKLTAGELCTQPADCASNVCLDHVCCEEACDMGEWCPSGACVPIASTPCLDLADCPVGWFCAGDPGMCTLQAGQGEACNDLEIGACRDGRACVDGVCCASSCDGECQECDNPMFPGQCMQVADGTEGDDECAVPGELCRAGLCRSPLGESCLSPGDCVSDKCVTGICCSAFCSGAEFCDGTGACKPRSGVGSPCTRNEECASNMCAGTCQ